MDTTNLIAYLPFDNSSTEDLCGNTWTAYGSPTIGTTNAFNGKALQLDGSSYIKLAGVQLGGRDFQIDGWCFVDSSSPNYARLLYIVNPNTGYTFVSLRKSNTDATKLDFWASTSAGVSQNSGNTYTSTINSVGTLVHFKLIYRYANKRMSFCINDIIAADWTSTAPQYTRQTFDIYIGTLPNGGQGLIGTVDELRIFDGTWFAYNHGTLPTAEDYAALKMELSGSAPLELSFDIKREVINADKTWWYYNEGTANTLTISGTTLTNLPATKSKTGSAFYQTARQKCFDLPATNEVWFKFDVYFDGSNRWRAYNGGANGFSGITAQLNGRLQFFSNDSNVTPDANKNFSVLTENQLQTVLLHMVSGSSSGVVEAWVDGTKIYTFTGDVNHGQDFNGIYLQSDGSSTFFSNVIISNAQITLGEGWHAFNSDVERRVTNVVEVVADIERITTNQGVMEFSFDAEINILRSLDLIADVNCNVQRTLALDCDIEVSEAISVEVIDDVARFLLVNIILFPIDNTQYFSRQTPTLHAPKLRADSAPVVIPSQSRPFQANNTQGIQSFEVLLEEHQLSAQLKFTSVIPLEPLQTLSGQFLDFAFAMFVENTRQEGMLISADCSASIDELLYSQLNYSVEEDASKYLFDFRTNQFSTYSGSNDYSSDSDDDSTDEEEKHTEIVKKATALTHLKEIVRQLFNGDDSALEPHFTDFVSNLDVEQKDISFSDLISSLFGWSSRIPNKQINIFARVVDGKEKLFVIKRGQEPNSIDISGTKHTLPIIEKSIIRTFVGSSPDSSYTMNIQLPGKFLCPPPPSVSPDGKTFYDYKNVSGYGDIENGYALESSITYNDDGSKLEVSYIYEEVNGVYTCVREVSRSYDENGELIDKKTTIHHRLSPSQQFSRMDDEDGNTVGSNVASNLPGFYNEKITLIEPSTNTKTITIPGNPLVDMSFPFIDIEDFERVSDDLINLNRSIQETVSLTIFDYPHLINFTDRIYFKGNEYFLVSNSALSSHNIFCQQSIVMRRWFSSVS